jgi:hypothetical protein
MTERNERRTAAYLPWKTLMAIFAMLSGGQMPHRIDRSMFPSYSGSVVAQVLGGLRFLELIDDDGAPTPLLESIVAASGDESAQKPLIRQMIERSYADLIALDLTKATRSMFEQKLSSDYGLTGSTRRKGARFFITAAQSVGIPLSPYIAAVGRAAANGAPSARPAKRKRGPAFEPQPTPAPPPAAAEGASVTVELASGGRLTLTATVNVLTMSAADRKFVFELIDQVNAYRSGETVAAGGIDAG